jgi:hypothetical protein
MSVKQHYTCAWNLQTVGFGRTYHEGYPPDEADGVTSFGCSI